MKITTQEQARSLLNYDPISGQLSWRINASRRTRAGSVIKSVDSKGYIIFGYAGKNYRAHRIIWLLWYGYLPTGEVDHKDRVRTNNAILNLRESSKIQNQWNRTAKKGTISGLKGACWDASRSKWIAVIRIEGKNRNLGRFDTAEEAHAAYCEVARRCHGAYLNTAPANDNAMPLPQSDAAASCS